jgi:hypothetical protein
VVLQQQHDEWQDSRSRFSQQWMALLDRANKLDSSTCFLPVGLPDAAGPGFHVPLHHPWDLTSGLYLVWFARRIAPCTLIAWRYQLWRWTMAGAGRGSFILNSHRLGYHCLSMFWLSPAILMGAWRLEQSRFRNRAAAKPQHARAGRVGVRYPVATLALPPRDPLQLVLRVVVGRLPAMSDQSAEAEQLYRRALQLKEHL